MSLQHILLGFLQEEPSTGYDLNKRLESQAKHFWSTEQSQIYRALYRMHESGWVTSEVVVQSSSPNKKVYSLTGAGQNELESWLHKPTDETMPSHIWLAKIYVGHDLTYQDVIVLMEKRREALMENRAWVQLRQRMVKQRGQDDQDTVLRILTLDHTLRLLNTEITWLDSTIERLNEFV